MPPEATSEIRNPSSSASASWLVMCWATSGDLLLPPYRLGVAGNSLSCSVTGSVGAGPREIWQLSLLLIPFLLLLLPQSLQALALAALSEQLHSRAGVMDATGTSVEGRGWRLHISSFLAGCSRDEIDIPGSYASCRTCRRAGSPPSLQVLCN